MNKAQFWINLLLSLNVIFLIWQIWELKTKLIKIFGEVETELSQVQRKIKELEKEIELLKSKPSK